jgi:hypothetical protein
MTTIADAPAGPEHRRWLWFSLIGLAAIVAFGAIYEFSAIFYDFDSKTTLGMIAQWLTKVQLALAPPIAITALAFAVIGRFRLAIIALASRILVDWICDTPSFAIHGVEFGGGFIGLELFTAQFLLPVIGVVAIVLAVKDTWLWLATLLVAFPTILKWAGVVAFAISVMLYGF